MHHTLVRDVMATEVVAVEPSTPFKEVAARLARHRISLVPVLDADRRVLGVVTEADLLLKQEYPDPEASVPPVWLRRRRRERRKAAGVVVLQGRAERRSLVPYLVHAVHGVEGVVRVENRLTFELDDRNAGRRGTAAQGVRAGLAGRW